MFTHSIWTGHSVVLEAHVMMRIYTLKVTVSSPKRLGDWTHWELSEKNSDTMQNKGYPIYFAYLMALFCGDSGSSC